MATAGKVIKCKAAVAWEQKKPLVIEEIEVAPPQANEVRIKIVATSVCHSDLYQLYENSVDIGFPTVLGHEAAGIVESVGPGVTEFQPGDKVLPLFIPQCGECRFCKDSRNNQCVKGRRNNERPGSLAPMESRLTCKGKKIWQFLGTSAFAEYTVVHEMAVAKIDPAAPLDKVCLIGCGICTGYGAAVNTAKVEPGSTCAVFGLGAVGLAAVMGCRAAGAKRIIAVDTNPEKFEKAKVFGATDFVNPKDHDKPINEVLIEMTQGGVDFSLECVGNVKVMRSALESCVPGWGVSVMVGVTDEDVSTKPLQLFAGRTWKGSVFGGFKGRKDAPQMVKAYMDKKLMVDEFITHHMTLDQVNDAIELMKSAKEMAMAAKVIKCKAAVAWEQNKPLVIEEIEVAPPQANEIRIKIVTTAVCHSDLYQLYENSVDIGFPTVLGHEAAGIVESVGPGVTEFQPGDKVIPLFIAQCGECRFCKDPRNNHCVIAWRHNERPGMMAPVESRFTSKGKTIWQFSGTSTFAEYTVVHESAVAKIDPAAPLDKVCLIGCGICTGYGAAVNTAKVEPGSTCAVFGLGAVGLAAVMGCRAAGAKRIIAVDINPEKFEKAKVFGATDFVNPRDHDKPINEVLIEMTEGGVDFSLECVGNVTVMRSALESCVPGWGVSVMVGLTDKDVSTKPFQLFAGRTWKGSVFGGFKGRKDAPQMVKAYMDKKLMVDEFITHHMTLDQVNDAIELMKSGKCIRVVLRVSQE
ncbi:uncharacterized protein V6R79_021655 [Siganus canaliculatus]